LIFEVRALRDVKYDARHFEDFVHMMIAAVNPFDFYIVPSVNDVGNRVIKFYVETIGPAYINDVELVEVNKETLASQVATPDRYFSCVNASKYFGFAYPYFSLNEPPVRNMIDTLARMCLSENAAIEINVFSNVDRKKIGKKILNFLVRCEHAGLGKVSGSLLAMIHGGYQGSKGDLVSAARGPTYGTHPGLQRIFNETHPKFYERCAWVRIEIYAETSEVAEKIAASMTLMNRLTITNQKVKPPTSMIGGWKAIVMCAAELANLINLPTNPSKFPMEFGTSQPPGHAFPKVPDEENPLREFMPYQ
jgi:hypothetical protein